VKFMIYAIFNHLYRLNLKARIDSINGRDPMISSKSKPVIHEELTWKDIDKLTKETKMAIISTTAFKPRGYLLVAANSIDCSGLAKRISNQAGVFRPTDKIVDPIAAMLVKFLSAIFFIHKKSGGLKRTI
jgi:hypothetical protein